MELKDRKFIKNTGNLPGFKNGGLPDTLPNQATKDTPNNPAKPITVGGVTFGEGNYTKNISYQNAAAAAPGLIGSLYNSWTNYDTKEDLESQYTNVPASVAGVGYTRRILNLKDGKLPGYKSGSVGNVAGATASGAAMGSVAGPWGAAIGGAVGLIGSTIGEIFSSDKQAENERAALNATNAYNLDLRNIALGKARSIYNAKKYGDPMAQSLYGTYASGKIASSAGPVREEATARVSNGEVIANKFTGNMYRVPGMKNNKDGKLAAVSGSDTIITNKYGLSDYAWRTGDIEGAEEMMKVLGKPLYKCGKLPKYELGLLSDVDLRSDTTRQGMHEGVIPWGAGETGVAASPLYLLDANITGNPNIITGEVPNPANKWSNIQQILKARKAASVAKQGSKAIKAYQNEQNTIKLQNELNEASDIFEFSPKISNSQSGFGSKKANGKKLWIPYKNGKLPGHAEGWLGNAIPAALGSIASLAQYIEAKNNKPYRPYTYAANPYERESLSTLAGLSINPYPIMNQLRSAEARTNRAIDIVGGLSGGQRTAARLANLNTTQNNIANLLGNMQTQNNAYKTTYAKAALEAGQQARTARMQANQWDLDMYSKAHAARNKGMQTGIANMLSQIQQYQANEFKRRQFNDTMDLYRADQKQRAELNAWIRNNYGTRGVGIDPAYNNPTSTLYGSNNPFQSYMDKLNYSKNNWEKEMLKKYPYLNRYNPYN